MGTICNHRLPYRVCPRRRSCTCWPLQCLGRNARNLDLRRPQFIRPRRSIGLGLFKPRRREGTIGLEEVEHIQECKGLLSYAERTMAEHARLLVSQLQRPHKGHDVPTHEGIRLKPTGRLTSQSRLAHCFTLYHLSAVIIGLICPDSSAQFIIIFSTFPSIFCTCLFQNFSKFLNSYQLLI